MGAGGADGGLGAGFWSLGAREDCAKMASKKVIRIAFPTNADWALTHQIRTLGEDLWREIERQGLGDLGGIGTVDQTTDGFEIKVNHAQMINRVRLAVDRVIARHLLTERAVVTAA
jgi:hypothetical protein